VDYVIGLAQRRKIPEISAREKSPEGPDPSSPVEKERAFDEWGPGLYGSNAGFPKVQDGCNSFCSYCIVPYARGRNRVSWKVSPGP
jgi:threonylcarbamoyladenosine tRNA methylthiotransferase MtaB